MLRTLTSLVQLYARLSRFFTVGPIVLLCLFLLSAGLFMTTTAWTDSAIIDEIPHIAAGYGYVHEFDARLNPEHPPIVKALAALPLLFIQPTFSVSAPSWADDVNGQWDAGVAFLYRSGNDANILIFLARIMPILLTLTLIAVTYIWARERIGRWWALLPALLLSFSPMILSHGHYVTTDIGAALGVLIALYSFTAYLLSPSRRRLFWAGAALSAALLLKFSTVLLIPFIVFLAAAYFVLHPSNQKQNAMRLLGALAVIFIIAGMGIYLVYAVVMLNHPPEKQIADTQAILQSFHIRPLADATVWMAETPIFRPLSQYALGVLMVLQRSAGGNTVFFLGEVATLGWWYYFPVMFFFKEMIPVLAMLGLALLVSMRLGYAFFVRRRLHWLRSVLRQSREYLQTHFPEFVMASFVVFYWAYSMFSPLNIGIRHILPTLPLLYILIAAGVKAWVVLPFSDTRAGSGMVGLFRRFSSTVMRATVICALVFWVVIESIIVFPHFLPYMNQFAGGTDNGYKIAVDSNYDWGQDMKRFEKFVQKTIPAEEKIAIDFFGWEPSYYLGEQVVPWRSANGDPRDAGISWFAISATFLQNSLGMPVRGATRSEEDSYRWLTDAVDPYQPDGRVGASLFVYKLDDIK